MVMSSSDTLNARGNWQNEAQEELENLDAQRPKSPSVASNNSETRNNYNNIGFSQRRSFSRDSQQNYAPVYNRRGGYNLRGKQNRSFGSTNDFYNNYSRENSSPFKGNPTIRNPNFSNFNNRQIVLTPQTFTNDGFPSGFQKRNNPVVPIPIPNHHQAIYPSNGSLTNDDDNHSQQNTIHRYRAAGTAPSPSQRILLPIAHVAYPATCLPTRETMNQIVKSEMNSDLRIQQQQHQQHQQAVNQEKNLSSGVSNSLPSTPIEKMIEIRSVSKDNIHLVDNGLSEYVNSKHSAFTNKRFQNALRGINPNVKTVKPGQINAPIQSAAEAMHTINLVTQQSGRIKNGVPSLQLLKTIPRVETTEQLMNYPDCSSGGSYRKVLVENGAERQNEELYVQTGQQMMVAPPLTAIDQNYGRREANGSSSTKQLTQNLALKSTLAAAATAIEQRRHCEAAAAAAVKCSDGSGTLSMASSLSSLSAIVDATMTSTTTATATTAISSSDDVAVMKKTRHLRNGLKPPPPPQSVLSSNGQYQLSHMDVLSEKIWHYHNKVSQTEEMLSRKLHLRDMLYAAVSPVFPMCGLYVVGSSLNGFGNNSSDMDLCLMITNKELDQKNDAVVVLNMILTTLQYEKFVTSQKLILAKVPILRIKFADPFADITVDLNANNYVAIKNTHLLCYYSSYDWRVRPLVSVVKEWAKRKGINDANKSSFTSYSLVLMVIHFLQCGTKPAVLPNLQKLYPERFSNKCDVRSLNVTIALEKMANDELETDDDESATLGELLIGFLNYYANKFDYDKDAISIRQGQLIERSVVTKPKNAFSANDTPPPSSSASSSSLYAGNGSHTWRAQWRCVCIEEPFTNSNTAHSIYDEIVFGAIKTAFRDAHKELEQNHDLDRLLDCQPINVNVHGTGAVVYAASYEGDRPSLTQMSFGQHHHSHHHHHQTFKSVNYCPPPIGIMSPSSTHQPNRRQNVSGGSGSGGNAGNGNGTTNRNVNGGYSSSYRKNVTNSKMSKSNESCGGGGGGGSSSTLSKEIVGTKGEGRKKEESSKNESASSPGKRLSLTTTTATAAMTSTMSSSSTSKQSLKDEES